MLRGYDNQLETMLAGRDDFRPFPDCSDRGAWNAVHPDMRNSYLKHGERFLQYEWPALPAELFREYATSGNRSNYEAVSFERRLALCMLAIAECLEDKGRFMPDLINGIWVICEESTWAIPAHNHMHPDRLARLTGLQLQDEHAGEPPIDGVRDCSLPEKDRPVLDLFAGETAALLAWTSYLLGDKLEAVSAEIKRRIRQEVNERVLSPYMASDRHWWMGVVAYPGHPINNWNPWCNCNVLASALLLEQDQKQRMAIVGRMLASVDCFIYSYGEDGGCDEGPGYWHRAAGSLFDALELLISATNGRINVYMEPRIKAMGSYMYKMHIAGDCFVNFADSPARFNIGASRILQYGRRIGDKELFRLGMEALQVQGHSALGASRTLQHHLQHLFVEQMTEGEQAAMSACGASLGRDDWLPDIEAACIREAERADSADGRGLVLASKGGHNDESHNHNDIGHYMIYYNGSPLVIDVGPETYSARTFGDDRYSIWTMQSSYHNLPEINGCSQMAGPRYRAEQVRFESGADEAELSIELARSYPEEAGLLSWKRTCRMLRRPIACIEIEDRFSTVDVAARILLFVMTAVEPQISGDAVLLFTMKGEAVKLDYDSKQWSVYSEKITISDPKLLEVWGEIVYRLVFHFQGSVKEGSCVFRYEPCID